MSFIFLWHLSLERSLILWIWVRDFECWNWGVSFICDFNGLTIIPSKHTLVTNVVTNHRNLLFSIHGPRCFRVWIYICLYSRTNENVHNVPVWCFREISKTRSICLTQSITCTCHYCQLLKISWLSALQSLFLLLENGENDFLIFFKKKLFAIR